MLFASFLGFPRLLVAFVIIADCSLLAALPDTMDWPHWRGPEQNGISRETGLIDHFNPKGGDGSNVLWKNDEAAGISTPIVLRGKLYTIVRDQPDTRRDGEKVICLDPQTGKKLWENRGNVFLSDVPAERIGWANCTGDPTSGNIYFLGSSCLLQCLDGETGKTLWARSLSEEFGMLSTYGGRTNTPVLFDDLVIVSGVTTGWDETARPTHRFLGFSKNDGRLVWIMGTRPLPEDTTYSTPFLGVIDGQAIAVAGSGDGGVYAFQPRTGKTIWNYQLSRRGVNVSPIVVGERVFIGHSEENLIGTSMGAVVAIDGTQQGDITRSGELWKVEEATVGKSSPLLVDGRLYTVDDSAGLQVFDAETGQPIGRPQKIGTSMRGSLLWADGKIFACSATGVFQILEPTEGGVKSIFRVRLPSGEECGGSPIVSHGRIYLPTTGGLYCLGDARVPPESTAIPKVVPERSNADDAKPAAALLFPAEAIVQPGESIEFELRLFNARGQRIERTAANVEYTVSSGGSVDQLGVFRTDHQAAHSVSVVAAKVDGLVAQSHVRVVPPLPWKFDFADNQVPATWVGARYRHTAQTIDGEPILVKISTIPKGTRSQSWMGPADLHDYTVHADLKAVAGGLRPDMGLIAQRYTLDMMGQSQQLQIRTWPPQLRMAKTIPFPWDAGVWYSVKLRSSLEGNKAVLQGKVWKRGEPEPRDWTISAEDEAPNLTGSPGLFGNATNAEIYIDNVRVTAN